MLRALSSCIPLFTTEMVDCCLLRCVPRIHAGLTGCLSAGHWALQAFHVTWPSSPLAVLFLVANITMTKSIQLQFTCLFDAAMAANLTRLFTYDPFHLQVLSCHRFEKRSVAVCLLLDNPLMLTPLTPPASPPSIKYSQHITICRNMEHLMLERSGCPRHAAQRSDARRAWYHCHSTLCCEEE